MHEASSSDAPWEPDGRVDSPNSGALPRDGGSVNTSATPSGTTSSDVEEVILGLAAQEATGCLTIIDRVGDEGLVWFRDGQVYAVSVPGRRPLLGVRLVTAGAISPEQLNDALHVQRTEMPASRLGEVLVHLGLVNRRVIENFALEQQRDMLAELLGWRVNSHWFRNGAHTRTDLAPFTDVVHLIEQARLRQQQWPLVVDDLGGPDVVPITTGAAAQAALTPSEIVILQSVDGVRSLSDIADACGYTVFEAADVLLGLMAGGLVTTARDLLDQSTWGSTPASEHKGPHLAEVLELHPVAVSPPANFDADLDADLDDELELDLDDELELKTELQTDHGVHDAAANVSVPGLLEVEPVVLTVDVAPVIATTVEPEASSYTLLPAPSTYLQMPPPNAAPVGEPLDAPDGPPAQAPEFQESREPADTAALLRELTSLGDIDGR